MTDWTGFPQPATYTVALAREWIAPQSGPSGGVAFSPDGRYVAAGAGVFDVASRNEVARFSHRAWGNAQEFSPDAHHVAIGSSDETARVLEVSSGNEVARLSCESGTAHRRNLFINGRGSTLEAGRHS